MISQSAAPSIYLVTNSRVHHALKAKSEKYFTKVGL